MDGFIGDPLQGVSTWDGQQSYPDTCAIRCQEYILESFTGKEFSESGLVQEAEDHGLYHPGGGTPIEDVGKLLELHGIPVESHMDANVNDLAVALSHGEKVIVGVDSGKLWGTDPPFDATTPDHALVVCGIDTRDPNDFKVLVADPGTGEMKSYEMAKFLDCVSTNHEGKFVMVNTAEPTPATSPEMAHFDYAAGHTPTILDMAYEQFVHLGDRIEYALGQIEHFFQDHPEQAHPDPLHASTAHPDASHLDPQHADASHFAGFNSLEDAMHDPTHVGDATHITDPAHTSLDPNKIDQVFSPDQHNYTPVNPEPTHFSLPDTDTQPTHPQVPTLYPDGTVPAHAAPVVPTDVPTTPPASDPTVYHDPSYHPEDPNTPGHQPWLPPVDDHTMPSDHAMPDPYAPHDPSHDPYVNDPGHQEMIHVHVEIDYDIPAHDAGYADPNAPEYHDPNASDYHDPSSHDPSMHMTEYVNEPVHDPSYDTPDGHTPTHDYHQY